MTLIHLRTQCISIGASLLSWFAASFAPALADETSSEPVFVPQNHILDISNSTIESMISIYAADARLEWIGGPLDGSYSGEEAIQAVWSKFIAARGDMVAEVKDLDVATNAQGKTVFASVIFEGNKQIPVRLTTTYRHGEIVSEIWQIDPAVLR